MSYCRCGVPSDAPVNSTRRRPSLASSTSAIQGVRQPSRTACPTGSQLSNLRTVCAEAGLACKVRAQSAAAAQDDDRNASFFIIIPPGADPGTDPSGLATHLPRIVMKSAYKYKNQF